MAGIVYTKLIDALKGIGIDVSQQQGSNVKKLFTKNKSTATKPGLLASERDTGGNFATVLDIFKDEAKYIDSMNDAEQMAFLNNIIDYNEFGGKSIKTSEGIKALDEIKNLTDEAGDLKTSIDDILKTAKTMKDEAEAGKKKALEDLDDFLTTGGQPLKKKDDKFLGGSMHEEGQLRTGIRQFLQTEYKNGRLKLNDLDKERIMEYSPMIEHDPIKVFKRIYGDEAYKKAGTFPGAFEKGESFKHYEEIFRNNMGEDLLKVKNKEYVGDGTLVLTSADEVYEPKNYDDDIPFAKGGRASFAGGKLVSEIIAAIVKKEPIEAMKEVNKVIGKKGKYKNLTKKDIDRIVEGTDDWIMQRDPDNLYVYDDGKTVWDDDLTKEQLIEKEGRKLDQENIEGVPDILTTKQKEKLSNFIDQNLKKQKKDELGAKDVTPDDMSIEDSLTTLEGLGATQTAERFRLKQKYPGITDDLVDKILIDDNPQRKAELLATLDEAFTMMGKGKGDEEILQIIKNTSRTKNSTGGRAGFYLGGQSGQSVIEPDLSDIGHGSDALMSRTRMLGPNSQATTSTGLNYLLGEDNDNTRVPFNDGLLVPEPKPYTTDMFEKDSMMLLQGMYGTGPESNIMFYNSIIDKGNKLRNQGVDRETVIEIIRKNKNKINAFLETQTTTPKTFEGLESFEMKADGGRIGFQDGLNFNKALKKILEEETKVQKLPSEIVGEKIKEKFSPLVPKETQKEKEEREMFEMVKEFQMLKRDGVIRQDLPFREFKKMKTLTNLKNKILELNIKYPEKKIIDENGMINEINLKSAIDEAEANLEISPIDGLKLKRSLNTEGEQSVTSGEFSIGNLNFMSDNIEEGQLTSRGDFKFGDLDLSGMVQSNDGKILNTELGFDYGNKTLTGKLGEGDGYRTTELELDKTFPISDKLNLNLKGSADTTTIDGKTYRSSDLVPKLSYNDGILSADVSKEILEGGDGLNLGLGVNYNNFYAKGDDLLSKDRSGVLGYQKEFGNKDDDLFFTVGGEKDIFDDNYTIGAGLKYRFADGGIAGLRQGYNKGNIVDKGRRGFLKLLGVTAGGVAALKTGLVKLLGKDSGAISKKVIDEVIIDGSTGAPAWLQPLVNKALRDGLDNTKGYAYKDAQVVRTLDTPTGKVDVYYDVRTGEVEIDYIGGNTALGESVQMRYTPGIADEGNPRPFDEFEATESIPEGRGYSHGEDYDYSIEMGENTVDKVGDLYSDTTELAELGGQKTLTKDIVNTVKKKKILKKMEDNPADFITDVQGDFVPD